MHFKDTINAESICSNLDTSIHDTRINTLLSQMHIFDLHYDDFYSTPPNQLHFFIPKTECERAQKMFLELKDLLAFDLLEINPNIATLTIVGTRFTQDSKYLQSVLQVLQANHIPILFLHTLETKIIVAIHYNHLSKAIIMLHDTVCNL